MSTIRPPFDEICTRVGEALRLYSPSECAAYLRHCGYRALWGVGTAVDAVVCTSTWFHARTHLKASLAGTVLREGRLLHAA